MSEMSLKVVTCQLVSQLVQKFNSNPARIGICAETLEVYCSKSSLSESVFDQLYK